MLNELMEKKLFAGKATKNLLVKLLFGIILCLLFILFLFTWQNKRFQREIAKLSTQNSELSTKVDELSQPTAVYEYATTEVIFDIIDSEIKSIGELATMEYMYTDAAKYSDLKEFLGYELPFTSKSFIIKWDGSIKAGIDLKKLETKVDEEQRIITVSLPEAEILSHEIDNESFETLDEKDNIFNPIKIDDIRSFDQANKTAMEEKVIENGMLEQAHEYAQIMVESLLTVIPEIKNDYQIVFSNNINNAN